MLILSRRVGEKIIIGDREVEMVIISFEKGQVKLGFEANKKIRINREEIFIKMENDQKQPVAGNKLTEDPVGEAANDALLADKNNQEPPTLKSDE